MDNSSVKFWGPDDYYRKGVEDATKPMTEDDILYNNDPAFGDLSTLGFVNAFLSERRKSLLTKKVTKWVVLFANWENTDDIRVLKNPATGGLAPFNTKEEAEEEIKNVAVCKPFGPFPIEVEVQL